MSCQQPTANSQQLLIEPVWNRNLQIRKRGKEDNRLLIEPVWNRNTKKASAT